MCTRAGTKTLRENTPHNILVDLNGKNQGELLSDSAAAPAGIASFGLDNGRDELWRWPFWAGFTASLR